MVEGTANADGKIQNPSVIDLITWHGLQAFPLTNTKAGDPVGGYGSVFSGRVGKNTAECAEWFSFHVLPAGDTQIDGTPGIDVSLDNLVNAGCPGSLFASSRSNP